MHQDDMAVSTSTCLLDATLALRYSIVAPISSINVPCYNPAPKLGHNRKNTSAGCAIGWSHVVELHAQDIGNGIVQPGHLGLDLGCSQVGEVRMVPCVVCDLMTRGVHRTNLISAGIDAAVECASEEKGRSGICRRERLE
jgi:hypothetical protein